MMEEELYWKKNDLFVEDYIKILAMGRMQSKGKGKGISGSCTPYLRKTPKFVINSPSAVC